MRNQSWRLDAWGAGLASALILWVGVAAAARGGRPWPLVALIVCAVITVTGAQRLSRIHPVAIPAVIAAVPIAAMSIAGGQGVDLDPLEYVNASAALFVISAAGATLLAQMAASRVVRQVAVVLAIVWILTPSWLGGQTAAAFALLLPVAVVVVRRPGVVKALLAAAAAMLAAGLALAVVLGIGYAERGRTAPVDRAVDATIGELRVVLWKDATDLIRSNPVFGVGPGRFEDASPTAVARDDARWAHNEYLQISAEAGVPAGILLLALVAWLVARLWSMAGPSVVPAAVAVAAVTLNVNIDYLLHYPAIVLTLAALVGATTSLATAAPVTLKDPVPTRAPRVVLTTVVLMAVLVAPIELLNSPATVTNGAGWMHDRPGVRLTGVGGLRSEQPPEDLYAQLAVAQRLSIEMVVRSHGLDQDGPARIVSMSESTINRNLTLGQDGDSLVVRLRTTATDWNATDPQLEVAGVFDTTARQHIAVATDAQRTRVYVDGSLRWAGAGPGGTFDNWNHTYHLLVGNEAEGDRGWRGDVQLLGIYAAILPAEVIAQLASGTTGSGARASAAALYRFDERRGEVVNDRSGAASGGSLLIPHRLPAAPQGLLTQLRDPDGWGAGRLTGHALLFGVWALVLAHSTRRASVVDIRQSAVVVISALVVVAAASIIRNAAGHGVSLVDVAGALAGTSFGLLLARALPRRPSAD